MTAVSLCSGLAQKDFLGEVCFIGAFVRDQIRYIRDINNCETLQAPNITLEVRAGDCDDKSMLVAALLMSIGYDCQFVACDQGRGYSHVWTQTKINDKWIDIETTEPVPIGTPSRYLKKEDRLLFWPIIVND